MLSEVASAIGGKLLSNPVVLIGLGIAAYLLWPSGDDDDGSGSQARNDGLASLDL